METRNEKISTLMFQRPIQNLALRRLLLVFYYSRPAMLSQPARRTPVRYYSKSRQRSM